MVKNVKKPDNEKWPLCDDITTDVAFPKWQCRFQRWPHNFQISLIFWFVSLLLTAKSDYSRGEGAENA